MLIHVVREGESLYGVGRAYGVNYARIAEDNELATDSALAVGQALVVNTGENVKRGLIEVNGYALPGIADDILEKTLPHLTYLSVFGDEATADGRLRSGGDRGRKLAAACQAHKVLPVLVVTNMDGRNGFSAEVASALSSKGSAQENFIKSALAELRDGGYAGMDIDFENIPREDREGFHAFLARLTETLHSYGYFVSAQLTPPRAPEASAQAIAAGHDAYDYSVYGDVVDFVTLMCYERGGVSGAAGAVQPMPALKDGLEFAAGRMESGMVMAGLANYGYDRAVTPFGEQSVRAISNRQAVSLACRHGARIEYDKTAEAPFFYYYDENDVFHQVWFEDARSACAKLGAPFHADIAGVSYWAVNWYFPQNWLVLSGMYDVMKG